MLEADTIISLGVIVVMQRGLHPRQGQCRPLTPTTGRASPTDKLDDFGPRPRQWTSMLRKMAGPCPLCHTDI
jgi:hypothetical protein